MAENVSSTKSQEAKTHYPQGVFLPWGHAAALVLMMFATTSHALSTGDWPWLGWVFLGFMVSILVSSFVNARSESEHFENLLEENKALNKIALEALRKAKERGEE